MQVTGSILNLEEVVSRRVDRMAEALGKRGKEVVKLGGSPIEPPPVHVVEAAERAAKTSFGAPGQGLLKLREALCARLKKKNHLDCTPDEILVTNGAMQALYLAFKCLLKPYDEVLIPAPSFFAHGCVELSNGTVRYVPFCCEENGYRPERVAIERAITSRTRIIYLNTPVNPTGYVWSYEEIEMIGELALRHGLIIVTDESYDGYVFDGLEHYSPAALPSLREQTVSIFSMSKTYALAGWRVGYMLAPRETIAQMRKVLEWMVLCVNFVAQEAAYAALTGPSEWVDNLKIKYGQRRLEMYRELEAIKGLTVVKPKGGLNIFPRIDRPDVSSEALCNTLMNEYGVPAHPGKNFGAPGNFRLQYGATSEDIARAVNAVREVLARADGKLLKGGKHNA